MTGKRKPDDKARAAKARSRAKGSSAASAGTASGSERAPQTQRSRVPRPPRSAALDRADTRARVAQPPAPPEPRADPPSATKVEVTTRDTDDPMSPRAHVPADEASGPDATDAAILGALGIIDPADLDASDLSHLTGGPAHGYEPDDDVQDEPDPHAELGLGSRMLPPTEHYAEDGHEVMSLRPTTSLASPEELEAQIRALEARLDGLIRDTGGRESSPPSAPPARGPQVDAPEPMRRIAESDFFQRQWGRTSLRERAEQVDEFGFDPALEARLMPLLSFLYSRWFRVEVRGVSQVPHEGRCLVVANHSGSVPLDGAMLRMALRREHPGGRELRWLAEDFLFYLPFTGTLINRLGAVRACQENAQRLLAAGKVVGVFPEGVKGIGKLFGERYRLQRFGRGGFVRLALRSRTPIVPAAIVGAEEASPMLYRMDYLAKALGLPYLPVTPTFPWLGPLGLAPAPTKWTITFGEPIDLGSYGAGAADDHVLVGKLSDQVRSRVQSLVDAGVARRRSVWFG